MHRGDRWGFPKLFGNNGLFKGSGCKAGSFKGRKGCSGKISAAQWRSSEHIFDYIQLSDDHAIFEISIPENWVGKTVGNIDIRKKYNITIMALKRDGKLEMSITPDTVLDKDVTMLVLGASRDIQKCFHI